MGTGRCLVLSVTHAPTATGSDRCACARRRQQSITGPLTTSDGTVERPQ